ncbi:fibronectin type 3 and ankyrin repeat domains protein 1-like [Haliotis cracherodii]|uniref:fibronectin type 3 and ankyrin repeat domains protein 1-like n=1 Tax=Haliotis cracherodii TaxID=6455 RepID=UPI0039EA3DE5
MLITFLILVMVLVLGVCCERPCREGLYGQLCDKPCDSKCRPRANKNTYCDKVTGACLEGCVPGWWGDKCNIPCSNNCLGHVCYQQTGQCAKGCKGNYKGDMCNEYEERTTAPPTKDTPRRDLPNDTHSGNRFFFAFSVCVVVIVVISGVISGFIVFTRSVYMSYNSILIRSGESIAEPTDDEETNRLWTTRNPSTKERKMLTDLHDASYWGDLSRVKTILSDGQADINCVDYYGRTPLMWAARQNQKEVFDFLVKKKADVSLLDKSGNNLLHAACHGGDKDIVRSVLSRRLVNINSRDKYGRTAVMMAANGGHRDVFDLLVTRKADLSLVDSADNTILHAASLGGDVELVEVVLVHEIVNINARNKDEKTAAMLSKENDHTSVYDLLVLRGCAEN